MTLGSAMLLCGTLARYPKFVMIAHAANKLLRSSKDTIRFQVQKHSPLQYAPVVKVRNAWRVLAINHFSSGSEIKLGPSQLSNWKIGFRSPYRTFTRPALTARRVRFADAYRFWQRPISTDCAPSLGKSLTPEPQYWEERRARLMMQASLASEGVRRHALARIAAGGPGLGPRAFSVRRARMS